MTDKRTIQRQKFAKAAERQMLKQFQIDVTVLDMGDTWAVLRTDGVALTDLETFGFECYRTGYRLFGADV
jgi:hypothetical protein